MIRTNRAALTACALLMTAPAQANDKRDFEACDGRMHPGKQDDGMRGEASQPAYFQLRNQFGGNNVEACTRALASPRLLPQQTLRKAHLLRARAAAYLDDGKIDLAIADIDAAEAATAPLAQERFFQRSMGVSLTLLRALALAQSGRGGDAAPLVQSALDARPYALHIQEAGAQILDAARPLDAASPSPWNAVFRLEPDARWRALTSEAQRGNFAAVLDLAGGGTTPWPTEPLAPFAIAAQSADGNRFLLALIVSLHTAYAHTAMGYPALARQKLVEVREQAKRLVPAADPAIAVPGRGSQAELVTGFIDSRARQVEARIAIAEGRTSEVIAELVATPLPRDAATRDIMTALRKAVPAKDAALVPGDEQYLAAITAERQGDFGGLARRVLLAPETPRSVVDYERARPNILSALVGGALSLGTSLLGGIERTDGFRSTENPDGTVKVEFLGNTPSAAVVQEMTLLRAAELAKAAGKAGFVITDRADYTRTMRTMRGAVEISSAPAGFKTELTIRLIDSGATEVGAFDALTVIDALGPLYYEERKPAR